ncbi:hypothetical protein EX30DRAFT_344745 [Ascodesmis nigricans]|uniref:Uncharacterized protein n=1 Tax=Ascodesmis nigricans TaxID=341454 RepID=A0A4S2MIB8_9PEZI|nr:hypothetical protein EX30DRAFT_344745 [Ascodesmis nigricans]
MPLALLTFHHIRNAQKITTLHTLTRTLSLAGVFRRGHPGVVLVSGADLADVMKFVKQVKRMRWQTCRVNGVEEGLRLTEKRGLREVEKVRDVVRVAEEAGEVVGGWVKRKMGFWGEGEGE